MDRHPIPPKRGGCTASGEASALRRWSVTAGILGQVQRCSAIHCQAAELDISDELSSPNPNGRTVPYSAERMHPIATPGRALSNRDAGQRGAMQPAIPRCDSPSAFYQRAECEWRGPPRGRRPRASTASAEHG